MATKKKTAPVVVKRERHDLYLRLADRLEVLAVLVDVRPFDRGI